MYQNCHTSSIAQHDWPKERFSTRLCPKCGDSFQLDLHDFQYDETIHRVRSGYSSGGLERKVHSKLLQDAQADIDRCQTELHRLADLSKEITRQQEFLEAYVAGIRCIMSPIYTLPQEILGEIFKYVCCSGDVVGVNCISDSPYGRRMPTLTISRICTRWYNLATSMPVLWSSFGTRDLNSPYTPFLFKLFLERSRLHPIDFKIDQDSGFEDSSDCEAPAQAIFSLNTSENSDRWRRVKIDAPESFVTKMLQTLNGSREALPGLVSFSIESEISDIIPFPLSCPKLQSLSLIGVALELEYPQLAVTELNLTGLTAEEVSRIITHCPNVGTLAVQKFVLFPRSQAPPMISCSAQSLVLDFGSSLPDAIAVFLRSMAFPALTRLELSDSRGEYETRNMEALCSMFERSHTNLTHLAIHNIPFTSDELLRLFLSVPSVTSLDVVESFTLSDKPGVYLVLKALIAPLPQDNQEFEVMNQVDDDGDDDDYSQFIWLPEDEEEDDADDREDEEDLDQSDKETTDIEVPEGQCLLPRLKQLNLVIRPRRELLLKVVRSRWRPALLAGSDHAGPSRNEDSNACVCLQTLHIVYPTFAKKKALERLKTLHKSLRWFKKQGMDVEVAS